MIDGKKPAQLTMSDNNDHEDKAETLGQMKQRHKLELRNLQNELKNFQKKAKKDKLSKKAMEAQMQKLEEDLKARHEDEMASLSGGNSDAGASAEAPAAAPEPPVAPAKPQGPTKAQRRKDKRKQKERERQERIEEENKHTVSERQIETDLILSKLQHLQLTIKDIPSDGHCMYHAVADQLKRRGVALATEEPAFKHLRRLTSAYMRVHADDFLPFLPLEEEDGKSLQELFEEYCDRVTNTSDWGGQLELRALACTLAMPIEVYSAESDVISMGAEFSDREPLQLTYHLHYYTLGEHFNSIEAA